jgi:hypothetical protein
MRSIYIRYVAWSKHPVRNANAIRSDAIAMSVIQTSHTAPISWVVFVVSHGK